MQTQKFCLFMYITEAFDYFASFIGHSFESWNWHQLYKFLKFMVNFWPISTLEHRTTKWKFWMIWWAIYYIWAVEIPRFRQFFCDFAICGHDLPPSLEKERVSTLRQSVTTFDPSKVAGGTRTSCVSPSPPPVHTPPPSVRAILKETPDADMISAWAMRNCSSRKSSVNRAKTGLIKLGHPLSYIMRPAPGSDLSTCFPSSPPLPMLLNKGISQNESAMICSLLFKKSRIHQKQLQTAAKINKKYPTFIIYRAHECNVL